MYRKIYMKPKNIAKVTNHKIILARYLFIFMYLIIQRQGDSILYLKITSKLTVKNYL